MHFKVRIVMLDWNGYPLSNWWRLRNYGGHKHAHPQQLQRWRYTSPDLTLSRLTSFWCEITYIKRPCHFRFSFVGNTTGEMAAETNFSLEDTRSRGFGVHANRGQDNPAFDASEEVSHQLSYLVKWYIFTTNRLQSAAMVETSDGWVSSNRSCRLFRQGSDWIKTSRCATR